jgi:hypothetical protein
MPEDNLATVLTNVAADARPVTRVKIANSPETRAFLDIGLRLLCDDLLDHRGPDLLDDHDAGTRLFTGLSQARLIECAEHEDTHRDHPRMLTVGMFRDRWRYKSRYTEDLIAYLLRPALVEQAIHDVTEAAKELPEDLLIKGGCYRNGPNSSPVLARKPASSAGRYCIRFSRVFTSAVSSAMVCLVRLASDRFRCAHTGSTGLSSWA